MMELSELRVFVRVADLGGVSGAARALGAPKSSVSRSVARLEATLGAVLFERGTHALRLTEAGRLFLPYAQRVLNDVEEAGAALDGLIGHPRGTLRVNAAVTFAIGVIGPMLPDFVRRYPEVRVVLDAENRVVDLAREDFDVVVRVGVLPDSNMVARRLGRIELWPCASPDYLARHGVPRAPEALADHVLLGWSDRPDRWTFVDGEGTTRAVEVSAGTVVPEPAALQPLLAGGVGIGRLPDFLARPLVERGELTRLLPDHTTEAVDVHAVYPVHRSLSAKVRVFVDALVAAMAARRETRKTEGSVPAGS
ncbi:LysR substrate-binding domain-containing protein [Methylobacterium fujisawaense]|jgi:DNA-binding transcriptional LysR family regulator